MKILGENVLVENRQLENANTLIIGAPGTGKTRSYVLPNMMNAEDESIIVLDPKGEIYDMTFSMMEEKGYCVRVLDFINPERSEVSYNPLFYCRSEGDIIKVSRLLVDDQKQNTQDAFWPLSSQMLCNALIGFVVKHRPPGEHNLGMIQRLIGFAGVNEDDPDNNKSKLDLIFDEVEKRDPDSWALSQYKTVKKAAGKTQKSIIISLAAEFCGLMTPQIVNMMSTNDVNLKSLCQNKTVLYVKCSDTDRSRDKLVALFFTQMFQELYAIADKRPTHTLPRPVHILLDDVGANLRIPNMDGIISTSRGRGISLSLILQSVGQLKRQYADYTSILNSCNNVVFLGGNDIETCQEMAMRLDKPLTSVLYKESNVIYVFRQGCKPIVTRVYDLRSHPDYDKLNETPLPVSARSVVMEEEEESLWV